MTSTLPPVYIDNLQYCRFDRSIFAQMREGRMSAVHVTICYHENFHETVLNIGHWNRLFSAHKDLIFQGFYAEDIDKAREQGRTAIFFGLQNCSPIEDTIDLVEICHRLGIRFMQLSYNNQSLLATGCYEDEDPGLTRMGRQVIAEMNRVGLVIDMSHSSERSTLEAIEQSTRPIAITHANPAFWHPARRNKSDNVLKALTQANGMIGFSLYPHHLANGSACTLEEFCRMIAHSAERYGVEHLGIGSDLCQNQPDSVVEWMRTGRWSKKTDYGEGSAAQPGFPVMPSFFTNNSDFSIFEQGLRKEGFADQEIRGIMGENWQRFYSESFCSQP